MKDYGVTEDQEVGSILGGSCCLCRRLEAVPNTCGDECERVNRFGTLSRMRSKIVRCAIVYMAGLQIVVDAW
jgi:hypothetical protein